MTETTKTDPWDQINDLADKAGESLLGTVALAFANYNSQVLNGGHQQWVENGHAERDGNFIIGALKNMNQEPLKEVVGLIERAMELKPELERLYADFREGRSDENDDNWQEVIDELVILDEAYYDGLDDRFGEALLSLLK